MVALNPRADGSMSPEYTADTQAFLDKRHRQQNKEILIRQSPGIGGCFFVFKYSINRKNKKISSGGCKDASQRFVLCKGILDRKK